MYLTTGSGMVKYPSFVFLVPKEEIYFFLGAGQTQFYPLNLKLMVGSSSESEEGGA